MPDRRRKFGQYHILGGILQLQMDEKELNEPKLLGDRILWSLLVRIREEEAGRDLMVDFLVIKVPAVYNVNI